MLAWKLPQEISFVRKMLHSKPMTSRGRLLARGLPPTRIKRSWFIAALNNLCEDSSLSCHRKWFFFYVYRRLYPFHFVLQSINNKTFVSDQFIYLQNLGWTSKNVKTSYYNYAKWHEPEQKTWPYKT